MQAAGGTLAENGPWIVGARPTLADVKLCLLGPARRLRAPPVDEDRPRSTTVAGGARIAASKRGREDAYYRCGVIAEKRPHRLQNTQMS